jgi:integrase
MHTFSHEAICREAWIVEGLSPKTIQAYVLVLARAEGWARRRGRELVDLTATEVRELADSWPRTRSSRVQLRTALVRFWDVVGHPQPPQGAVLVPTKPRYGCRAVNEPQAALLAEFARADQSAAGLAVMLALYAGLRRSEIAELRWSQVDLVAGWLHVVGKGGVTAELPIHAELALKLAAWPRSSPYLFPGFRDRAFVTPTTVWTWSRRLSRAALGEPVATHRLRHTAIATLHDATGDLRTAQAFARHLSPETTSIYTRVSRRREAAVAAIDYAEAASA